jgi:hypothetical protein
MGTPLARRSFVALLSAGATAFATSWLWTASDGGEGFDTIARWSLAGGERQLVAVNPGTTDEELRALGLRLREEFAKREKAVIMIFDSAGAARIIRRGSRIGGERGFQEALTHQRAMYLKDTPRKEHTLTLYAVFPQPREVIHYGLEIQDRSKGEAGE